MSLERRPLLLASAAGVAGMIAGCLRSTDADDPSDSGASTGQGADDGSTADRTDDESEAETSESGDEPTDDDETDGSTGLEWDVDPSTWRTFQGSSRNLGYAGPVALPASSPAERWTASLEGAATASPAVVDGTVYVADDAGVVTALDGSSGETEWQSPLEGGRLQTPCVLESLVVVGTESNRLVALDAATGEREWEAELAGPVAGPTGADGTIYVGTDRGETRADDGSETESGEWFVYAVDAATGSVEWETPVDTPVVSYPAVTSDTVYVGLERIETLEGWLFEFDREDGTRGWGKRETRMQPPVALEGRVLAPGLDVSVYAESGLKRGQFSPSGHVLWPPAATSEATITVGTGGILSVDGRRQGGPRWIYDVGGRPVSGPVVTDDLVVLAGPEAELVACEYETGTEAWTYPLEGAFASTPAVADDALFVGTDVGTVYALE